MRFSPIQLHGETGISVSGGGQGGGRLGERGAGGIREAGVEGAGSGIPKVAGSRRNRESYPTLHNILQSKKDQEV